MTGVSRRLADLRARDAPGCEPLWREVQPPEELVRDLAGDGTPLARLQVAAAWLACGDRAAARSALAGGEGLPPGLSVIARELEEALAEPQPVEAPGAATRPPPDLADHRPDPGDQVPSVEVLGMSLETYSAEIGATGSGTAWTGGKAPAQAARLRHWLQSVRSWREVLGV